ncbi:DUF4129 domain-containing protein [Actinotalea sp. K2]|uniref:DUF4129 domain-containing protein n=1 Tax=Actinotalea sp. K2 TaxID=2939438 RepID=UPI002017FBE9|nr:DUF4129 domain-containing protein [Actinotalea sp. K2]MCL3861649.1 DUF4129 domain-containing protein [Actinotalea sp. K2]
MMVGVDRPGEERAPGSRGGADAPPRPAVLRPDTDVAHVRRSVWVVSLLSLAVVVSGLIGPWSIEVSESTAPVEVTPGPAEGLTPTPEPDPLVEALRQIEVEPWDLRWLWTSLLLLVLAAVVTAAVLWLRRLEPRRAVDGPGDAFDVEPGEMVGPATAGELPDLPALRRGLADADTQIRARRDPADVIIAAWVALEAAAGGSGVTRHPAATPTEFTVEVLDRTPADRTATRVLLGLYLQARFGDEPLTAQDVIDATTALDALSSSLADRPSRPSGGVPGGPAPDGDVPGGDVPDGDAPDSDVPGEGPRR